jgi:hypothetical protein
MSSKFRNLNDHVAVPCSDEVLDVLVEKIQGTENDDIAVLLLGYEEINLDGSETFAADICRRHDRRIRCRPCFETRIPDWLGAFPWRWPSDSKIIPTRTPVPRLSEVAVEA